MAGRKVFFRPGIWWGFEFLICFVVQAVSAEKDNMCRAEATWFRYRVTNGLRHNEAVKVNLFEEVS